MARLKIKDAPLLTSVVGDEKIPTGGKGDFTLTPSMLLSFVEARLPFATTSQLESVRQALDTKINTTKTELEASIDLLDSRVTSNETSVLGVVQDLTLHKSDKNNPHSVTKSQVGLGNVDNTSDANKPISTATQAALNQKANTQQLTDGLALKLDKQEAQDKIYKNGAALPYDASINYNEGAVVVKDGELQQKNGAEWKPIKKEVKASDVKLEDGSTQDALNKRIQNYGFTNYTHDARMYGIIPNKITDWTSKIFEVIQTLPEDSIFYIPKGTKWEATTPNSASQVYTLLPDNCIIIDDSGYEARYGVPDPLERWQASQQIYYKTKDYGAAGRRNGNGLNIRSNYHSYLNFEIDAPVGTVGCKGSIIWRANNILRDSAQFGLNQDTTDKSCIQIATYGTYSSGSTVLKVGLQSSIAPHSFNFNADLITGNSYVFGKRARVTQGEGIEDDATWKSSPLSVRWSQVSGHTGAFIQNWVYGTTQTLRQTISNDGSYEIYTKNNARFTITPDGGIMGKLNVLDQTTSVNLTSTQSGSFVTNFSSSSAVVAVLPKAAKGLSFEFSVDSANNLRITPNSADNFVGKGLAKYMQSAIIGSKCRVVAISNNAWTFERTGNWVDES